MLQLTLLFFYCSLLRLGHSTTRYESPFGCLTKLPLSDQNRTAALASINGLRTMVAQGKSSHAKLSSDHMYKLAWDCDLEIVAQTAATRCPETPQIQTPKNAMNYRFFPRNSRSVDLSHPLQTALQLWEDPKDVWPADNIFNGNQLLLPFANLINENTTAVGCSSATCWDGSAASCVFSLPDVKRGELVYTLGRTCKNGQQCDGPIPSVCENGLCVITMWTSSTTTSTTTRTTTTTKTTTTPNTTTTTPNTATTTSNTTTTTPNTTTTTPSTMATTPNTTTTTPNTTTTTPNTTTTTPNTTVTTSAAAIPTTTGRSADCPSTAFSSSFRELALGMHNIFRSRVARGLARNGEYGHKNAPSASRMDLMEYDCHAERLARKYVRLCDRHHPSLQAGYSENVHVLETTDTDEMGAIESAIAWFTDELAVSGIPSNMKFTNQLFKRQHRTITSVSKVLWSRNRHVGCATQLCQGYYLSACMYRNPVNIVGKSIYHVGPVCSVCPADLQNCTIATGLCSS